ncbi:hypothetical protein [Ruminococcus sp.]|uniref:hypothetical protein n=1 Tax=Ruminococcus sp. TaxID=41978 RepID=UPI003867141C
MKKIVSLLLAFILAFSFTACGEKKTIVKGSTASLDEILAYTKYNAQENSSNVNGRRYNINIDTFTEHYNELMFRFGGDDYINIEDWKRLGETKTDANGVQYYCYYYDIDKAELTVSVEVVSKKIMNVGCGTTMSKYVSIDGEHQYSDRVLTMAAVMAVTVGGYTSDDIELFKKIFNQTTLENQNSLAYENNIFNLSTGKKDENKDSTMLFRYFPVTDEHLTEWNIPTYSE